MTFRDLRFVSVRAGGYSEWVHAEFGDSSGIRTTVETTCGDRTPGVIETLTRAWVVLKNQPIDDEDKIARMLRFSADSLRSDLADATAVSALRSAVAQTAAVHAGASLTEALGGQRCDSVPLYANINRSLFGNRSTTAFAAAAESAVLAGYTVVKCAPFDEVDHPSSVAEILELAEPGLRRVAAIVEAVGESATVLVDCHSRFEVHAAPVIGDRLAELGVGWFEEPLDPVKYPGELTVIADSSKIPLAGGENGYGADFFEGLVTAKAVETVMPDVKHCGGVAEAYRAGVSAVRAGGRVSLHSPSGPLSQLAGAHVTAAVPGAFNLEHAVNEVPWRAELLFPPEVIRDGRLEIPEGVGLGAELDRAMVERHGRTWRP